MFCYVCEYLVAPDALDAFVAEYGDDGAWVRLFRRDPAYLRTELYRDVRDPHRFITIDHWTGRAECYAFRERWHAEYEAVAAACEPFKRDERYFGDFERVGTPAGAG